MATTMDGIASEPDAARRAPRLLIGSSKHWRPSPLRLRFKSHERYMFVLPEMQEALATNSLWSPRSVPSGRRTRVRLSPTAPVSMPHSGCWIVASWMPSATIPNRCRRVMSWSAFRRDPAPGDANIAITAALSMHPRDLHRLACTRRTTATPRCGRRRFSLASTQTRTLTGIGRRLTGLALQWAILSSHVRADG